MYFGVRFLIWKNQDRETRTVPYSKSITQIKFKKDRFLRTRIRRPLKLYISIETVICIVDPTGRLTMMQCRSRSLQILSRILQCDLHLGNHFPFRFQLFPRADVEKDVVFGIENSSFIRVAGALCRECSDHSFNISGIWVVRDFHVRCCGCTSWDSGWELALLLKGKTAVGWVKTWPSCEGAFMHCWATDAWE